MKASARATRDEKTDAEVLGKVGGGDIYASVAKQFDVEPDDPRVPELVSRIIAKGYKPNEWLAFARGAGPEPQRHGADPRKDTSAAQPTRTLGRTLTAAEAGAKELPPTEDESLGIETGPITGSKVKGAVGFALTNPDSFRADAEENAARVMTYPALALDSVTAGGFRKARDFIGGKLAPEATAAVQQRESQVEGASPFLANSARAVGYVAPVGLPAMAGRAASAATNAVAQSLPSGVGRVVASRPVAGALGGAGTGGLTSAAETAVAGGSPEQILESAGHGAALGAAFGGGLGTVASGLAKAGKGAQGRIDSRLIGDLTEGAPATKRDRIVGKGGEKFDRAVETAKRTPELVETSRDPNASLQAINKRIEEVGSHLDDTYAGKGPFGEPGTPATLPTRAVSDPLVALAAELEKNPATRNAANEVMQRAQDIHASWGDGTVPASEVRKLATAFGKDLFRGNPNLDPTLAKSIREKVYGSLVETIGQSVEKTNPGSREALSALNAEMSDLLNMRSAVESRVAREATPTTRLAPTIQKVADAALMVTNPGAYAARRAAGAVGPSLVRGADQFLAGSSFEASNPLLRALEASQEQNRRRAELMRGTQ